MGAGVVGAAVVGAGVVGAGVSSSNGISRKKGQAWLGFQDGATHAAGERRTSSEAR